MTTRISQYLRRYAAAQRISMEEADPTVQGPDAALSADELAKVADKAAAEVDAAAGTETPAETDTPDDTLPEAPSEPAGDVSDTSSDATTTDLPDAPAAPEEGSEDTTTDVVTDTPAETDTDTTAEDSSAEPTPPEDVPVSEIETPAEDGLDALAAEGPEGSEAVEKATDAVDTVTDPPAPDTDVSETPTEPSPEVSDPTPEAPEPAIEPETPSEPVPAQAPSAKTDTNEAVQEVVELTEALAQAQTAEEVVKEANEIGEGLGEVRETAEVINENGGVSVESLALLHLAIQPYARRLGHLKTDVGVSFEAFADPEAPKRLQVSLEELDAFIEVIDTAKPQLERQRIESLDRVVCALQEALPSAVDRLKAVLSQARNTTVDNDGAAVAIGDGVGQALSTFGAMPEDLEQFLYDYAQFGKALQGPYQDAALRAARTSSLLNNAIDFTSALAFWEKLGKVVDSVVDPRSTLTVTQLETPLPGGSSLFSQSQPETTTNNKVVEKLLNYNLSYQPLEATVVTKEPGQAEATYPALSSSKLVLVGDALLEALCCKRIDQVLDDSQKLWPEAQDAVRHLKENLSQAPENIELDSGADFSQITKFVETNYSLATWPLVNYLANLVLTTNAFVVFAERSLAAKAAVAAPVVPETAAEAEITNADPTTTTDPVAE